MAGKSNNSLYPLQFTKDFHQPRQVVISLLGIRNSSLGWHFRLGHPSSEIVSKVVKSSQLPASHENFNKDVICVSCQMGKCK
jgi:hypothetical protein